MNSKKERKGLSVKTTDKKEVVPIKSENVEVMPSKEKKEALTLDSLERELVQIEKDRTWLERLLNTDRDIQDIKDASRKLTARKELRDQILALAVQENELKVKFANLKVEIQRLEFEEAQLQQKIKDIKNVIPEKEEDYELKGFEKLKENPTPEDDTV